MNAKTAAESAKTAAVAAQKKSEAAQTKAETAQTAAEQSAAAAQTAKEGAETAQSGAQAAQAAAESAKAAAQTAQTGAETARTGAETAKGAAEDSAEDAEAWAVGQRNGTDVPSTDPAYHNNAKYYKDQAQTIAGGEFVSYGAPQPLTDAQQAQARDNINAPAPYEAGDNISITGRIITTKAFPCNPNLLDNWYFGNPVNQRGQTSYTGAGYGGIDRFTFDGQGGTMTVGDGFVSFQKTGDYTSPIQFFENSRVPANQIATISAIVDDDLFFATGTLEGNLVAVCPGGRFEAYRLDSRSVFRFVFTESGVYKVRAVGLEPGTQQTLAHKEYGEWVQNEIPKFGDQLAECQRYCVAFNKYDSFLPVENNDFVVELPVPMRATPTIINPQNLTNANVTNPTVARYNIGSNQLRLRSTASHGGSQAVCNGLVLFSADL